MTTGSDNLGRRPKTPEEHRLYNLDGSRRKTYTEPRLPCFYLYREQIDEAKAWEQKHLEEKHSGEVPNAGAIGGAFGWRFIGTGLGEIAIYYCMCGEEVNVTDFDNW